MSAGLTDQQSEAVELRGTSVALSAGAGCGKTHVLVERYLAQLAPDSKDEAASLSGLIAITYTDRAAREMRDRVRRRCRERLSAARSDAEGERWLALLRELETARISTIHAFCAQLLRAHAVEAGVDPRFQILQGGQEQTLFSELMDDQLRELLGRGDDDLLDLAVKFGISPLRGMLQDLLARRDAIDFGQWSAMTPEKLVERWSEIEQKTVWPELCNEFLGLPAVATIRLTLRGWAPTHPTLVERFGILREQFAALDAGENLQAALTPIREAAAVKGVTNKHWDSLEVYGNFRDAAEAVRKWIDKINERVGIDQRAEPSAKAGLALLRVAEPVFAAYEARKRELGLLDFNDLMIYARDLLRGPHGEALRRQISGHLSLLLVDEFQDTNPLQVELVTILCGQWLATGKLFFVGDEKQSIYRFRGAEPAVSRKLSDQIPKRGRRPLSLNFRSQPAILDFVNALFVERLGLAYEPLRAARPPLATGPQVEFLWAMPPADAAEEPTETQNAEALRRREADWIARRLAQLLAAGEVQVIDRETKQPRPVAVGDVAILFRSLSDVRYYEEALRRYAIPHYLVGGRAFYAQQEVFDLLNLLRYLSNARDVASLAGVLRSPFFSVADETLFWLAQHPGGLAAGLAAATLPQEIDDNARHRVRYAAQTLAELRAMKDRVPIATLIREALARTGYDALLVAEFLGERKLGNLRKLIDQARGFDESGVFTLADYVHELAEFVARKPDEPDAPVELESGAVVRLMTIHQAKGLEFPLVVVPDLERRPQFSRDAVAFDPELGPLLRVKDDAAGPCGLDLYRLREKHEDAEEEIRKFYVATTRAADYLILSAGLKDLDQPGGAWMKFLGERFSLSTGELKGAIPADYPPPQVAVTLAEPALPEGFAATNDRKELSQAVAAVQLAAANGTGGVPELVAAIPSDRAARRVYSFSRLAGTFERSAESGETTDNDPDAAADLAGEPISSDPASDATELGKLVHAVLAQIDFSRSADVAAKTERELQRNFARATVEPAAATNMIERFLRTPRAAALRDAQQMHRELEFLLSWPLEGGGAGHMIQGFIDCLYQDKSGAWHVLDFKTNRVTAAAVPNTAAQYQMQMYLYALAAEQVLGASPASLVLSFLHPGVEHVLTWDEAARRQTIAQVEVALRAAQA